MGGNRIYGVCRAPSVKKERWFVKVHAVRYVGGGACRPEDFPDEGGDVFWAIGPDLPSWVRAGALLKLEIERSPLHGQSGRCWYQAVRGTVEPVSVELIDLSTTIKSEDTWLRRRQVDIDWPVPPRIYLRIGSYVYGPFNVKQQDRTVVVVDRGHDYVYYRYPWSDALLSLLREVRTPEGQTRWIVEDEAGFLGLAGSPRDGRDPRQLVSWYLKGLRDSIQVPQEIRDRLTRKAIRAAAEAYSFFSEDPELREHQVSRLEKLGDVFAQFVRENPSVIEIAMGQEDFARAVKSRVDEVVREQSAAIECRLEALRAELSAMEVQRAELEEQLSTLRAQLAEERKRFDQEIDERFRLINEQRKHLVEQRERILRDFWVLHGLLQQNAQTEDAAVSDMSEGKTAVDMPQERETIPAAAVLDEFIEEPSEFARQLLAVAGNDRTRILAFERLHNAIREHRVFALKERSDFEWLRRYVTALGPATRVHHVIVETGWSNLEPLFGRVNPGTRRFEPSASESFEFWVAALDANHLANGGFRFLILHDANRSPLEVWMVKFLRNAAEPDSFPLRLFHPRQVAVDDPFRQFSVLPWPENLRVVCVLTPDPYSYEPTEYLTRHLPVLSFGAEFAGPMVGQIELFRSVAVQSLCRWDWKTVVEGVR